MYLHRTLRNQNALHNAKEPNKFYQGTKFGSGATVSGQPWCILYISTRICSLLTYSLSSMSPWPMKLCQVLNINLYLHFNIFVSENELKIIQKASKKQLIELQQLVSDYFSRFNQAQEELDTSQKEFMSLKKRVRFILMWIKKCLISIRYFMETYFMIFPGTTRCFAVSSSLGGRALGGTPVPAEATVC